MQDTAANHCEAEEFLSLVSVNPVQNVEEPVETKGSHVMRSDVFYDSHLIEHNDLWEESEGFEPERVAPGELPWGPSGIHDQGQNECSWQQNFQMWEIIIL